MLRPSGNACTVKRFLARDGPWHSMLSRGIPTLPTMALVRIAAAFSTTGSDDVAMGKQPLEIAKSGNMQHVHRGKQIANATQNVNFKCNRAPCQEGPSKGEKQRSKSR